MTLPTVRASPVGPGAGPGEGSGVGPGEAPAPAPAARRYVSAEPASRLAVAELGLRPLLDLGMRLGEGSGAVLAVPVIQAAARVVHEGATFESAGVAGRDE